MADREFYLSNMIGDASAEVRVKMTFPDETPANWIAMAEVHLEQAFESAHSHIRPTVRALRGMTK